MVKASAGRVEAANDDRTSVPQNDMLPRRTSPQEPRHESCSFEPPPQAVKGTARHKLPERRVHPACMTPLRHRENGMLETSRERMSIDPTNFDCYP